jgi:hypothetical protein
VGGSEKSGSRDEPMMRPDETREIGMEDMMVGLVRRMV